MQDTTVVRGFDPSTEIPGCNGPWHIHDPDSKCFHTWDMSAMEWVTTCIQPDDFIISGTLNADCQLTIATDQGGTFGIDLSPLGVIPTIAIGNDFIDVEVDDTDPKAPEYTVFGPEYILTSDDETVTIEEGTDHDPDNLVFAWDISVEVPEYDLEDQGDGTAIFSLDGVTVETLNICQMMDDGGCVPTLVPDPANPGTYLWDNGHGQMTTISPPVVVDNDIIGADPDPNNPSVIIFEGEGTNPGFTLDICGIVAANCNTSMALSADGTGITFVDNAGNSNTVPFPAGTADTNTHVTVISSDGTVDVDDTGTNADGETEFDLSVDTYAITIAGVEVIPTYDPDTGEWTFDLPAYPTGGGGGGDPIVHTSACFMSDCNADNTEILLDGSNSLGAASYEWWFSTDDGANWTSLTGTTANESITDSTFVASGGWVQLITTSSDGTKSVDCGYVMGCAAAPAGDCSCGVFEHTAFVNPECIAFDSTTPEGITSYENGYYLTTGAGGQGSGADPNGSSKPMRTITLSNPNAAPVLIHIDMNGSAYMAGVSGGDLSTTAKVQWRLAEVDDDWLCQAGYGYMNAIGGNLQQPNHLGDENRRWVMDSDVHDSIGMLLTSSQANQPRPTAPSWQYGTSDAVSWFITLGANETVTLGIARWAYRDRNAPALTGIFGGGSPACAIHIGAQINVRQVTDTCCEQLPITVSDDTIIKDPVE